MNNIVLGKGDFKFWSTSQRMFAMGCIAFGLWAVGWFTWTALDIIFPRSSDLAVKQDEIAVPVATHVQETVAENERKSHVEPSFPILALPLPMTAPAATLTPAPETPRAVHRSRRKMHKYYPPKPIPAFWVVRNN